IEAEIDTALERVRATDQSQVVDVLLRAHAARVVSEVCVWRGRVNERERQVRIGKRCGKGKEEFAETKNCFVGHGRSRRPAPINGEVLRSARRVHEVCCARKNRTTRIRRIAKRALASLSIANIKQTGVCQVEVKLGDEVILLFMLRRTEVESGSIPT